MTRTVSLHADTASTSHGVRIEIKAAIVLYVDDDVSSEPQS